MALTDTAPFEQLAQMFEPRPAYETDPVAWVEHRGEEAWSTQRQIMAAICAHRTVAVPSCHGVGKSHIASRIAAWWVDVHGSKDPTEVFLVTTAPTAAQVAVVLWRYIGQVHRAKAGKPKLIGKINRSPYPQWIIANDVVGFGRKPADYEESAFQGIHALHTLIIVDEACGILPMLWDQLASLASNLNGRILAIGNPTDPASYFYTLCKPGSDWHVIQIDALRTPNFSDEGTRDYPLTRALMQAEGVPFSTEQVSDDLALRLVSPLYVEERIRAYCGFTQTSHLEMEPDRLKAELVKRTNASAMFLARVRGVFPTRASEGVIPYGWVQLAVNRWHDWDDAGRPVQMGRRVLGVDVAYTGDDQTVVAQRQGQVVEELRSYVKQDTVETADAVHPYLDHPQAVAVVDVNGVGAGVYDTLNRRHRDGQLQGVAIPFNASSRTKRRDYTSGEFRFQNDRSAAWWRMRELLDPSRGSQVALPDDEALIEELCAPKHKVLTGGIIQVESKDDIKKRLHRSTDRADATIQSYWLDGLPIDTDPSNDVPLGTKDGAYLYEGYEPIDWSDLNGGTRPW